MDNIKRFETISDYNLFNNNETLHPLVSVVDLSKVDPRQGSKMYFGFYTWRQRLIGVSTCCFHILN
jgi:hypothetical protein